MDVEPIDVIICGFGPTGSVAASLLGQRGVRILVVERETEIISFPRAVHFDGEVMRIFQSLGLADAVQAITRPAAGVRYINGRRAKLIETDFTGERVRHGWARGHYFSQPELEAVLRKNLTGYPSVQTRLGWEVTGFTRTGSGIAVAMRVTGGGTAETVAARYLLACDGAASAPRRQLGDRMRQLGPPSTWLVCDTLLDRDIGKDRPMYQVCDPARPVTIEPCSGRHARWEFRVLPGDSAGQLESEGFARSLIQPYLRLLDPVLEATAVRVQRSQVYTFRSAVAPRWRFGSVFLLGDAAHLMPPFLGQGMCAGIRDAFNLCWKLAGVLRGDYSEALLDTYESERAPHVTAAICDAARIATAIQARNPVAAWLRDNYLRLRTRLPFLARPMAREASWSLGPGLFDEDNLKAPPPDQRNLFDQAVVETHHGEPAHIDDLLGAGFALLFFGYGPDQVLDASTLARWKQLGAQFVSVVPAGERPVTSSDVSDPSGVLDRWRARVGGVDAAVIRPDRQVFGRYRGSRAALAGALEQARESLAAGLGLEAARGA